MIRIERMIDGGEGYTRADGRWVEILRPNTTGEAMSILGMASVGGYPVRVLVPSWGEPYWAEAGGGAE